MDMRGFYRGITLVAVVAAVTGCPSREYRKESERQQYVNKDLGDLQNQVKKERHPYDRWFKKAEKP